MNEFNSDTLAFLLHRRAASCPADIAYSFPELSQHYTWETLWKETRLLAKGLLQLGVTKGDSLALLMTGRMELIVSMFAAASIGAVIVPLNAYSKTNEVRGYLQSARPKAMIIGTEGHHLDYPSMLMELILECRNSAADNSWLPSSIFVVGAQAGLPSPLRPFNELMALASHTTDEKFINACKAATVHDPLILLYTSGTTGSPKGVLRTTASFMVAPPERGHPGKKSALLQKTIDRIARRFSVISLLPLYHLGGFGTIFTNLRVCNIRIVLLTHFNPLQAVKAIRQEACRMMIGTPYMVQRILSSSQGDFSGLSSLIGISFTSASVDSSLLRKVNRELRLLFFMVTYGSSETGSVANATCFVGRQRSLPITLLFKLLTRSHLLSGMISFDSFEANNYSLAGKVDRAVEVNILNPQTGELLPYGEQGEVSVRSHRVMRYLKHNQDMPCFTADGWYKTGDLGYLDDQNVLTITGRLRRLISRGGEKISPVEIEGLLLKDKDVEEAFVIGIPDELYGEQICACLVAKKGANVNAQMIKNRLAVHLSAFKIPQYVLFLPELPLSPTGKIAVTDIKQLALHALGELKQNA
ncbi:class I adenylate-forming enzyme family protein [Paenibacillus nasutitermitis]|uniref:Acid--CoA ligase n=1 Tax=Paenibacillus nasutitermitis TaxID=1652958 RepID=A0A916ZDR8_9BACL|nr:class I adenylate-forming enzyme family protein [Paenibacillus nasutitermitis]GGD90957.1 acid--CoA ligase [Paenibacillus nasutitermitis]